MYALKVENEYGYLLAIKYKQNDLIIEGTPTLATALVDTLIKSNLSFNGIHGEAKLITAFKASYLERMQGSFFHELKMSILTMKECIEESDSHVKPVPIDNKEVIRDYFVRFNKEALNEDCTDLAKTIDMNEFLIGMYGYFIDDKLVSIARSVRENESFGATSLVYTLPEYRGHGYAKKVVGTISNYYLSKNKTPYLFVDDTNLISNACYKAIGYKEALKIVSYHYHEGNIKRALFAGGCFWCMANPYYTLDGVFNVYSGYAGGTVLAPTYEETKKGTTGHKETVLIVYDETKISYKKLVETYFSSIDPFDSEGQFIDRGSNYQTAIFTNSENEIKIVNEYIRKVEEMFHKKVYVPVLTDVPFFMAEEYHQNYSITNKKAFMHEEEVSHRVDFKFIDFSKEK